MPVLGFATVVLAFGLFLWFAGIYLPADRQGWTLPKWGKRDAAVPIPILVDRSDTPRLRGEVNPPATLWLA